MDPKDRPTSLTITALLIIVAGIVVPAISLTFAGPAFTEAWKGTLTAKLTAILWVIVAGPAFLAAGAAILGGRDWGRWLFYGTWPLSVLLGGAVLGFGPISLVPIIPFLIFVALLTNPAAASYFGARASNVLPIARRELIAYFYSPIAYNVLAVFLFISGFFFFAGMMEMEANMRGIFYNMGIVLLFLSPTITMRLMSEEMKMGTVEPLMTAPVTDTEVVLGKFLAGIGFYIFLLAPTLAYPFMLSKVGELEWGPIWAAYLGLVLIGCVYISVGLLISSLTKDQVIAAVAGFDVLLSLWLMDIITKRATDWLSESIRYVTLFYHFDTFVKGLVDTRDIVFYLSLTVFFLFLSVRVVEARKWR